MPEHVKYAVLGAGISGLAAAHALMQREGSEAVLLLEADDRPGGYCRTDRIDGFLCDQGPNGFLDSEPRMLEWIGELGLTGDLIRANKASARRFLLKNGRLVELLPPPKFLFSPVLSVRGRLRLLREPFIPPKRDGLPESIHDFAARRVGIEAAETLVNALVTGIFGGDSRELSLEHCFPRMAAMEREHGGLFKALRARRKEPGSGGPMGPRGTLTTFKSGIGALPERAAEMLGERLQLQWKAASVSREGGAYRLVSDKNECIFAKCVICALPAHAAAEVLAPLDNAFPAALLKIRHAPIAVLCTGYPREAVGHDLDGFGFLAPRNQGVRVLGCIWTSSVFPHNAPGNTVFLRTMYGGSTDPDAVNLSDGELLEWLKKEVHPLLQIAGPPEFVRIYRHRTGIPQYRLDHGQILAELDAALSRNPNLRLIGNAYRGVSLNDCVARARQ